MFCFISEHQNATKQCKENGKAALVCSVVYSINTSLYSILLCNPVAVCSCGSCLGELKKRHIPSRILNIINKT